LHHFFRPKEGVGYKHPLLVVLNFPLDDIKIYQRCERQSKGLIVLFCKLAKEKRNAVRNVKVHVFYRPTICQFKSVTVGNVITLSVRFIPFMYQSMFWAVVVFLQRTSG
jgi:hypothetical protein